MSLMPPRVGVELVQFALEAQNFLLLITVDGTVGEHGFKLLEAFDALLDGGEVGEGAAHPAVGHVGTDRRGQASAATAS